MNKIEDNNDLCIIVIDVETKAIFIKMGQRSCSDGKRFSLSTRRLRIRVIREQRGAPEEGTREGSDMQNEAKSVKRPLCDYRGAIYASHSVAHKKKKRFAVGLTRDTCVTHPRSDIIGEGWEWYKNFDISEDYIHERAVNKGILKRSFNEIHNQIVDMGWSSVFEKPGLVNINHAFELYSNLEKITLEECKPVVYLRGSWVPLTASTLCAQLGVPDFPIEPLKKIIWQPHYKAIWETLCGLESKAKWERYDGQ
ncbi:hypothetical protein RND71_042370 [Anisodus tanguticus]|uniref:Uncharacterized protein n=1 Tax=Anisodus tanguticus TaxID=243964 RepID=A0AAE1UMY2_9SOLA|nr:hypothetical protein RND71_042370 [Anisodus tanguticus]